MRRLIFFFFLLVSGCMCSSRRAGTVDTAVQHDVPRLTADAVTSPPPPLDALPDTWLRWLFSLPGAVARAAASLVWELGVAVVQGVSLCFDHVYLRALWHDSVPNTRLFSYPVKFALTAGALWFLRVIYRDTVM